MKLLHVIDTMDPKKGGVSAAVNTMAEELAKMGISNEVVHLDLLDPIPTNCLYRTIALGPTTGKWRYNKDLISWLLNNFFRFDTIIVHGLWLYSSFAVYKALRKHRKFVAEQDKVQNVPKVFIMPHGMLDPYFQTAPGRKFKAIRNWFYWKVIESRVINNADGLLFTCKEERLLAKQPFNPYRPKRDLVIGMGVKEPPILTMAMSQSFFKKCTGVSGSKYFLFLSRIDEKKGIDILLLAYARFLKNTAQLKFKTIDGVDEFNVETDERSVEQVPKLVIAGPGLETPFGKKMKEIVKNNSLLKSNVFFPGMLEGDAKWGAFYGADVFVLPSHQENFGIAVVEALACSKPVLISKQVNINQEIDEDGAGIVSPDTLEGTYASLQTWNSTSDFEKLKMANRARVCFEKHYSVSAAAEKLIGEIS
jgi:glycosyltransferase involved in cell wall biosynthesis